MIVVLSLPSMTLKIFVSVQPSSTTLPFPLPTRQGRRDSQLRTMPKRELRMLPQGNTQDTGREATSANL